jgi:hypothetical protein
VLEGFILDLGEGGEIDLVAGLFLRGRNGEEQQSHGANGCRKPEAEQFHDILAFTMTFGREERIRLALPRDEFYARRISRRRKMTGFAFTVSQNEDLYRMME